MTYYLIFQNKKMRDLTIEDVILEAQAKKLFEETKYTRKLKETFEEIYNPTHFYCRLRELNLDKSFCKKWAEIYELGIYKNIIEYIKKPKDI
jgi:hypothetical protein